MVNYGAWQQGPDYTSTTYSRVDFNDLKGVGRAQGRSEQETGPQPFDGEVQKRLINTTGHLNWTTDSPWNTTGLLGTEYHELIFGDALYRAGSGSIADAFSAYYARRELPIPGPAPPGAVSWEYESSTATVLNVYLEKPQVQVIGDPGASNFRVYTFHPHSGATWLLIKPTEEGEGEQIGHPMVAHWDAGAAFTYSLEYVNGIEVTNPQLATIVVDENSIPGPVVDLNPIDLTTAAMGEEAVVLWASKIWMHEYPDRGRQTDPSSWANLFSGELFNWLPTFTLRPPRHRWIYQPSPAPTRVFPRDDGLATSTASRVWPPPRSEQGSNRRGPGTYT